MPASPMRLAIAAALLVPSLGWSPARAQLSAPGDGGCASAIERWQAFAEQENQGGHMDTTVFDKIQAEIARANDLCQAGQDEQARRAVDASRHRHGY